MLNSKILKITEQLKDQGIVCKEGNNSDYPFFNLQLEPGSQKLRVVTSRTSPSERRFYSSSTLDTGKWYAIAVTYNPFEEGAERAVKLYIKNETDSDYQFEGTSSGPWSGIALNGNTPWTIGRGMRSGNPKGYVDGIIDEVRISNEVLSPENFLGTQAIPPEPYVFSKKGIAVIIDDINLQKTSELIATNEMILFLQFSDEARCNRCEKFRFFK